MTEPVDWKNVFEHFQKMPPGSLEWIATVDWVVLNLLADKAGLLPQERTVEHPHHS